MKRNSKEISHYQQGFMEGGKFGSLQISNLNQWFLSSTRGMRNGGTTIILQNSWFFDVDSFNIPELNGRLRNALQKSGVVKGEFEIHINATADRATKDPERSIVYHFETRADAVAAMNVLQQVHAALFTDNVERHGKAANIPVWHRG